MADITFTIDAKDTAGQVLQTLMNQFGSLGRIAYDVGTGDFGGALATGINTVIDLEKKAIKAAADHQTSMVKLSGTLRSMGRDGELSATAIERNASALMQLSAFDDEDIIDAYTAISQFENVPTANLEQIVKAAMDLSAVMGGDLASNAENIARVLETGVIPRTWGFSAALKTQIQDEIKAGETGKALNDVLDQLNQRYGGQAAAELDTYNGQIKALKNSWGDLLETIGGKQLFFGESVISFLTKWVKAMTAFIGNYAEVVNHINHFQFKQAAEDAAQALRDVGLATNETTAGMYNTTQAFREADAAAAAYGAQLDMLNGKTVTTTVQTNYVGNGYIPPAGAGSGKGHWDYTQHPPVWVPGYANGTDFIIPPGFNENFPIGGGGASSGERVTVTPQGKASGPVDLSEKSLRRLAAIVQMAGTQ